MTEQENLEIQKKQGEPFYDIGHEMILPESNPVTSSAKMFTATDEQIAQWKKEHGKIFRFKSPDYDKSVYCRKPTRKEMSYISNIKDPLKFNENLLKACWLDGDDEILSNEDIFLGLSGEIPVLLEFAKIEVEKL